MGTSKNGTYVSSHYRKSSSSKTYTSRKTYFHKLRQSNVSYNTSSRSFSKGMKQQAYRAQGGQCRHCGKSGSIKEMEADHTVPYSKGGRTTYSNLQIICRPCNRSKGNRFSH